jgi:hypothetical protein
MITRPVKPAADTPETDRPYVAAPPTQPEIIPPLKKAAEVHAPNPNPMKK